MTDRQLYVPREAGPRLASREENDRVRALFKKELDRNVLDDDRDASDAKKYGDARARFAEDWVNLSTRLGLKVPGDPRTPVSENDRRRPSVLSRRTDSAETSLRHFTAGKNLSGWMLTGIESVICDRRGFALPGKAYQVQQSIPMLDQGGTR